ncbi:alpha-ketoglutarate-dependent dioxygenase AlkB [Shewanella sp. WXL01]|uniref:alpha-ketoglutarate-dependent dioxygenase AlkB family protein n=1 Tax=Shewanella sp. WXL01 TaxID=2709721 RepID=UPI0014383D95|nr:alpha-ketoglutarate-dependent dioxygenase AlkB [Shewanella sp. WXL01]NKF49667.1 alpha-ketoglutarate-dependent dioxygenase AlkB [Shewanella sp. WXL01]
MTQHESPPLTLIKQFLPPKLCLQLWQESQGYPLEKIVIQVFGKYHPIPRTQVWFADSGCDYKYSGSLIRALPWPQELAKIRLMLTQKLPEYATHINGVLVNHYVDGQDCMGWHSDNEPEIVKDSAILSLTLGAARDFVVRHKVTKQKFNYLLAEGDLLIMHGGMQQAWEHALPKRARVNSPRLNYTFRHIKPDFYQKFN